jgi:hypothetical protein
MIVGRLQRGDLRVEEKIFSGARYGWCWSNVPTWVAVIG